jgi:hypothetical protein
MLVLHTMRPEADDPVVVVLGKATKTPRTAPEI